MSGHWVIEEGAKFMMKFLATADHDKLRAAIARIKARATACPVPVPVWARMNFSMAALYESIYRHLTNPKHSWRVAANGIVYVYDTEEAAMVQVEKQIRGGNSASISRT